MTESNLDHRERRKRKREAIAIVVSGLLLVVLTVAEFNFTKFSSTLPFVNSIFFFGLLNVNLIILIALVWLIFRNIGKVFLERRRRILGSRLKTKLITAFLGFSIIPTVVLFIISAAYINSSFDKWFSIKIQNTFQASLDITRTYYKNSDLTAMHFAEHISKGMAARLGPKDIAPHFTAAGPARWMRTYLEDQRELLALDAVEYYPGRFEERVLSARESMVESVREVPAYLPRLPLDVLDQAFDGQPVSTVQHIGNGDLIRCLFPVRSKLAKHLPSGVAGLVVVSSYIPVSLVNKVDEIASVLDDYKVTNPLKYPMKTAYTVILILITLVILFVAIWIGLYLARELTVPVERLVYGAQAVGAGNLDVTIVSQGHDEIAVLVDSFNKMTQDLRDNRSRLEVASRDIVKRRAQLEAVLTNIGTGVLVVDKDKRITTFNRALSQLLGISADQSVGKFAHEVFTDELSPVADLVDRVFKEGNEVSVNQAEQWSFKKGSESILLACMASVLRDDPHVTPWGVVIVLDDMTLLVKGQREMAWREVARRIAHEIKNPLTPIKLSAQRLQRRLGDLTGKEGALLKECTETIIKHTDELKELVNEFSNFARFPEISPSLSDLHEVLKEVLSLYRQAHSDSAQITFEAEFDNQLPAFEFDRDQIKRVLINILDNAVAALIAAGSKAKTKHMIRVETHFHRDLQIAVMNIHDNGPGMTEETRNRVFEPYFSTKAEGTGLGLAIAKRIVNDHDGFIRVQSALGEGTQFVIELPTRSSREIS